MFKKILTILNVHADSNQKWTLSIDFITGFFLTYISPQMMKAIITALPAEWLAFESLFSSVCGLVIGMMWQGAIRKGAIKWFLWLCAIESMLGFLLGMYLCFVEYNVWVFAIATLVYGTFVTTFIGKCIMAFKPKLWNEHDREVFDNNNSVVCGIYCILGFSLALVFMPSLKVALFVWGMTCALDNVGWMVVYARNKDSFREIEYSD